MQSYKIKTLFMISGQFGERVSVTKSDTYKSSVLIFVRYKDVS